MSDEFPSPNVFDMSDRAHNYESDSGTRIGFGALHIDAYDGVFITFPGLSVSL